MKILQVIPALYSGGAETFTVELTEELCKQGHSCDVLTLFDVSDDNARKKQLTQITNVISLHKKLGFDIRCFFNLYRYIKTGSYDVVHVHVGAVPYILLSTLLLKNVRFVATIHSEARREAGTAFAKWSRFLMFRLHKCIPVTISEESKHSFDAYYKMNAPMIYNAVSDYKGEGIAPLKDNEEQYLFVHPASCQPIKNQELLIRAFAKLVVDFPNAKMLWLGSNTTFKALYDSLVPKMVEQFKYLGAVSNVRDYLIQADAMCLSSRMEGMPMTIIEAFSVGTPALCTPVGGIVDMIEDGENGMLSASMSVEDYYSMLKIFCNLPAKDRKEMRKKAKESFAKYSIRNMVENYLRIYSTKDV